MTEWTEFCKVYAKKHNCSYKQAMSECKESWTQQKNNKMRQSGCTVGKAKPVQKPKAGTMQKDVQDDEPFMAPKKKVSPNTKLDKIVEIKEKKTIDNRHFAFLDDHEGNEEPIMVPKKKTPQKKKNQKKKVYAPSNGVNSISSETGSTDDQYFQ